MNNKKEVLLWGGISLLIVCLVLSILCLSERQYNKKWLMKFEKRIESANNSNDKLFAELAQLRLEFDSYRQLTSDEFESTWHSFSRIRGNFMAIGYGYHHLVEGDITPEEEIDIIPEETKD